jgi:protein SCO1/2
MPVLRRSRSGPIALAVAVCLLAATLAGIHVATNPQSGAPVMMAPDFTLLDQDARPFTLSALRGHPVAIVFGYTHCPDECPLTLAHLTRAMRSGSAPRDERIAFITVDPARDTPGVLKRYLRLFDSGVIGLTGNLRALGPVYDAYAMPRRVEATAPKQRDYSVTHGTTIYFVARDGSMRGYAPWDAQIGELARDFQAFQ